MKVLAIKTATAIAGGLIAFWLNYLVSPEIGETPIYPGAIFYLAIAYRNGLPYGLISAGIAALSLQPGWLQCLPFLETAGLYWLICHRKLGFYLSGALFWACIGAPFVALIHQDLFTRNQAAFVFGVTTFITGGMLNLILAGIVSRIWAHNQDIHPTLSVRLYDLLVLFTAVPILAFAIYAKHRDARNHIEKTRLELINHSGSIARELQSYLTYNQRSIASMAASFKLKSLESQEEIEGFLARQSQLHPAFLTMVIANASGIVTAGYLPNDHSGHSIGDLKLDVSDRMYFSEVKRTKKPYISGVFQGRGIGSDPIVAMSAPLFSSDGNFLGIVEGSLDLAQLRFLGSQFGNPERSTVVILDSNKKVIYAPPKAGYDILQDVGEEPFFTKVTHQDGLEQIHRPDGRRQESTFAYSIKLPSSGWHVVVTYYLTVELATLNGRSLVFAIITLNLIAFASFMAQTFSRKMAEPLRALIAKSQIINTGHPASLEPIRVAGSPREVLQLVDHFETMAHRLETTHSQLMETLKERDKLNADLKAHNQTLDRRVKERTAELEKAKMAAEKADVAKSTFLANMSHEIRTPMNALIGLTDVLVDAKLNEQQREYVGLIQESSRSLLEIINSILDYSKIEVGKMTLVPGNLLLDALFQSLVGLFHFSAREKGLKLNLELDGGLPQAIVADKVRFRQILSNLLSNAIKFTKKGSVTVKAFGHPIDETTFALTVQVIDTGIGIPPEEIEDVFKAFEQSSYPHDSDISGTGLGLAISRKLAEMMGGTLEVVSQYGEGSTFSFNGHFTIAALPEENQEDAIPAKPMDATICPRLLVVEDHLINRKVCEAILQKLNCDFLFAENGQVAIDLLETETFDMVLMDCQMPVMDGYQATEKIRESGKPYAKIPIIALTANALSGDRERCLNAGMDDFLSKPFHLQGLRTIISKWLGVEIRHARSESP